MISKDESINDVNKRKVDRSLNLINQKFNKLTAIEKDKVNPKTGQRYWKCLCDCGEYTIVNGPALKRGAVKSCGCLNHLCGKYSARFKGYEEISGEFLAKLSNNAKYRKLEYELKPEYIWNLYLLQSGKCALTGLDITFAKSRKTTKDTQTASLDRIDSSKGYIEGNVQWVHKTINIMKSNMSDDEFIDWCKLVAKNN